MMDCIEHAATVDLYNHQQSTPSPMPGKNQILSGLLTVGLFLGSTNAFCQSVVDDNRIAAGYYSRQQWAECIEAFQELIARHPHTLEASVAYFYLGEASMQSDDFRNGYRAFQQYLLKHPHSDLAGRSTFRMGEAAYQLQNDPTAIRLLEEFVNQHPDDPLNEFALPYLGEMRLRRVEPQLAARVFETSLQRHPEGKLADRCAFGLARSYQLMGRMQEAIDTYQISANNPQRQLAAEADIQIGHIFLGQDEIEAAQQHLQRAVNHASDEETLTEASYWLARTHILENDNETAFDVLAPVIGNRAAEKIAIAIVLDASQLAVKLGKADQAFEWLSNFLEQHPDSVLSDAALHLKIEIAHTSDDHSIRQQTESLVNQFMSKYAQSRFRPGVLEKAGRYQYVEQNYTQAAEIFERLLHERQFLDPNRATADRDNWLYLGALSYLGQHDFVSAESNLSKINVTTAGDEIRCLTQVALATARFGQKKYHVAIPCYQHYLTESQQQDNPDLANLLRARYELTLCYVETDLWSEAIDSFKELQSKWGDDEIVNHTAEYIANRALETGQPQQATQMLERLVLSSCGSEKLPVYLSSLAWVKYENGDMGQAIELFHRLIEEFPDSELAGPAAMALAKSFDDTKQYDRAAQMYGWVIRHFSEKEFSKVARLRRAHSLLNSGEKGELEDAIVLLLEYLSYENELSAKDEALYQLGWVNLELGNQPDGVAAFRRLLQEYPNSKYRQDATLRLAQMSVAGNRLDEATESLSQLTSDVGLPTLIRTRKLFLLGEIAAKKGNWLEVTDKMTELVREIEDNTSKTKATYWLAEAAFRQANFEQSADLFRYVREHHENLAPELHPWIWLRLAQSLGQLEKWSEAKSIADEGKERFSPFAVEFEFDFLRARGLENQGRLSDARELYHQVIQSPKGGNTETAAIAQWRIGEIFFHQENYSEAIKAYYLVDSNFAYEQWRSAALLQAGKCQEHLKNWEHARKLYTRLIDQFPASPHRQAAEERMERIKHVDNLDLISNFEPKATQKKNSTTIR